MNYPLYSPKCKQETRINVKQLNLSVIKEPDAESITLKVKSHVVIGFYFLKMTIRYAIADILQHIKKAVTCLAVVRPY